MSNPAPAAPSTAAIRSGPRATVRGSGLPPFQRLIDAHSEDVWRLLVASVGREDAEDCYQETFVSALRAYPRLRGGRDRHNLRAWLLTIAHHKALDAHRARARRAAPVDPGSVVDMADRNGRPDSHEPHGRSSTVSTAPPAEPRDRELWDAIHALPERQRSAVVLRFIGDLAHREIAAAIGCSEEAARRSLHEGLKTLRQEVTA